jgi:hypothetical protein
VEGIVFPCVQAAASASIAAQITPSETADGQAAVTSLPAN